MKKHLFEYHGINEFDTNDAGFPDLPKEKTSHTIRPKATRPTSVPDVQSRIPGITTCNRTCEHTRAPSPSAATSAQNGSRASLTATTERGHGDKKFICVSPLKNGSTWGCKASFGRADKLADHFWSRTGQKCLRPRVVEKLQEGGGGGGEVMGDGNMFADQVGENADALLTAGKSLPSFGDFLRLCGLDKSVIDSSSDATSSSEGQG